MKRIDLSGKRFGKLTVINLAYSKNGRLFWFCKCDCGKEKIIKGNSLMTGNTQSCGCIKSDIKIKHNMTGTRLYRAWRNMKDRCLNPKNSHFQYYGQRGITICEEWLNDFQKFHDWAYSNNYNDNLTIDRIDVNGDYCPENCRWVTWKEQIINRRATHFITFNGITKCFSDWARFLNVTRHILYSRVEKFGEQEAIRRLFMEGKYDSI